MARPIPIAARRRRVVLEAPVETADSIGGVIRTFAPVATLWARLEPIGAGERTEGQQADAKVTHRLTLRWRGDVAASMRFSAGSTRFVITGSYDPDGRRRDLVCLVEEVQP